MTSFPCPICGDPRAFPFWFGDDPPEGCPQDKAWQTERGVPSIRSVTECRYQMNKAWQAAEFRRLVPDAFDENGRIKPGAETIGRVLQAFHEAHPNWSMAV